MILLYSIDKQYKLLMNNSRVVSEPDVHDLVYVEKPGAGCTYNDCLVMMANMGADEHLRVNDYFKSVLVTSIYGDNLNASSFTKVFIELTREIDVLFVLHSIECVSPVMDGNRIKSIELYVDMQQFVQTVTLGEPLNLPIAAARYSSLSLCVEYEHAMELRRDDPEVAAMELRRDGPARSGLDLRVRMDMGILSSKVRVNMCGSVPRQTSAWSIMNGVLKSIAYSTEARQLAVWTSRPAYWFSRDDKKYKLLNMSDKLRVYQYNNMGENATPDENGYYIPRDLFSGVKVEQSYDAAQEGLPFVILFSVHDID